MFLSQSRRLNPIDLTSLRSTHRKRSACLAVESLSLIPDKIWRVLKPQSWEDTYLGLSRLSRLCFKRTCYAFVQPVMFVYCGLCVGIVGCFCTANWFVHNQLCLSTAGYDCVQPVMFVCSQLCLSTAGYVFVQPIMFVLSQLCLHTAGYVCVQLVMFV